MDSIPVKIKRRMKEVHQDLLEVRLEAAAGTLRYVTEWILAGYKEMYRAETIELNKKYNKSNYPKFFTTHPILEFKPRDLPDFSGYPLAIQSFTLPPVSFPEEIATSLIITWHIGLHGAHPKDKNEFEKLPFTPDNVKLAVDSTENFIAYTAENHPQIFKQTRFNESDNNIQIIERIKKYLTERNFSEAEKLVKEGIELYGKEEEIVMFHVIIEMSRDKVRRLLPSQVLELENLLVEPIKNPQTRYTAILLLAILKYDFYEVRNKETSPDFNFLQNNYFQYLSADDYFDALREYVHYSNEVAAKIPYLPLKN